jgi:nidogen (entactin)
VFWSDWNRESPKLEWANSDGTGRSVFLKGAAVKLPNSLSIDFESDELCWADAGTKSIGKYLHYLKQKCTYMSVPNSSTFFNKRLSNHAFQVPSICISICVSE